MKPNTPTFIIAGASRSGTTSLWYYLRDHPDIFMPDEKEVRYFDKNRRYGDKERYLEFFSQAEDESAIGEASPPYFNDKVLFDEEGNYLFSDTSSAERIFDFDPDMKIVISLRNPVDRAYSQYWKNRTRAGLDDDKSFREVIEEEVNGGRSPEDNPACWLFKNGYGTHLSNWLDIFPEDQIKVVIFDEWIEDEEAVLEDICEFLDVDPDHDFSKVVDEEMNSGTPYKSKLVKKFYRKNPVLKYIYRNFIWGSRAEAWIKKFTHRDSYPPMSDETRDLVYEQLEDEIEKTEELLGRDLDVWRP